MSREELKDTLTVKDVSEFLRVSRNTVYDLINQEAFPVHKFGRVIRINRATFLAWFDGR